MVKLVLKSNVTEDLLDLDSLLMKDDPIYNLLPPETRGAQALAGVTGLGLPPVQVQWIEGAGDGSTFRGQRVLPRDIDLPLFFEASDRPALKELLSRLARMMTGECQLRIVEPDESYWFVNVRRVGGGTYVYGSDTIGETDMSMVLTLRAGDPFWTSSSYSAPVIKASGAGRGLLNGPLTALKLKSGQAFGDILMENRGDAPAYPVWEITGPGANFKAVSPTGEVLQWNGTLLSGVKLTIDTKTGKVFDSTGANRFASMAPAPRMWKIPPGTTTAKVTIDTAVAGTPTRIVGSDRQNHVTNPNFGLNLTGYTTVDSGGLPPPTAPVRDTSVKYSGTASMKVTTSGSMYSSITVAGLVVGKKYYAQARVFIPTTGSAAMVPNANPSAQIGIDSQYGWTDILGQWSFMTVPFTASAVSRVLTISLFNGTQIVGGNQMSYDYAGWIDNVSVSEAEDYFDGESPNTLTNEFEWVGTAHASKSRKWDIIQAGETMIKPIWRDRKWMVV